MSGGKAHKQKRRSFLKEKRRKLRQLLASKEATKVQNLEFATVGHNTDLDQCRQVFEKYRHLDAENGDKLKVLKGQKTKAKSPIYQKQIKENGHKTECLLDYLSSQDDLKPDKCLILPERSTKRVCSVFATHGTCQFGLGCKNGHPKTILSRTLLIKNFYTGSDDRQEFQEFYQDVYKELNSYGKIRRFYVCKNKLQYIRGSLYVQYKHYKESIKAYRALLNRFYDMKLLQVEMVYIEDWTQLLCRNSKTCPRGNERCKWIHPFDNE